MAKVIYSGDAYAVIGTIKALKENKQTFVHTSTNYTHTIKWGNDEMFFTRSMSKKYFPLAAKIKKEVKASGIVIDHVPQLDIQYYGVNEFLKRQNPEFPTEIINIDITAAYLAVLRNAGFISEALYAEAIKAGKMERLKAVGMLATYKTVWEYLHGKLVAYYPHPDIDQETRNIFFYCCYIIGELMAEVGKLIGNDFLFYWVDGIYVNKGSDVNGVIELIEKAGYDCKIKLLDNCGLINKQDTIFFSCESDSEYKTLEMPINEDTELMKMYLKSEMKYGKN